MHAVTHGAESRTVSSDEDDADGRGAEIQRRLSDLGISDREFYDKTGIDRKTLKRAIAGVPGTRPSTYIAITAALDRLERMVRGEPADRPEADYVEFTVEGNFGVRAVVKGPVKDMDELQRAVARLVKEMRQEGNDPSDP